MESHPEQPRPGTPHAIGRGAQIHPPNRFERVHAEDDFEHLDTSEPLSDTRRLPTVFLPNESQRVISTNDSPDVPFRYSLNPYRGCAQSSLCLHRTSETRRSRRTPVCEYDTFSSKCLSLLAAGRDQEIVRRRRQ